MNPPAIHAVNLCHAYRQSLVLKEIELQILPGDFFIVIGPNGSGKTTLLKLFGGLISVARGQLELFGRSIKKYPRKQLARKVAYVPQMAPLDFPFTVSQVVSMGRAPHLGLLGLEQDADLAIARQAMEITQIDHLFNRPLHELSGGECQRVYIARAICQQTDIILLDEPTASLDLAHQIRIMDLMADLRKEKNLTVVMVSHDINLAALYGSRLLLLKDGGIIAQGAPVEVLSKDFLEKAYGCPLLIDQSPLGEYPRVTPIPGTIDKGKIFH